MPDALRIEREPPAIRAGEWLQQRPPATRMILQGGGDALAAAASAWPAGFAHEPCRALSNDFQASLWLGPGEFLLLQPEEPGAAGAQEIFAALEHAIGAIPHSLVDVSHRQTALAVTGPYCTQILNGGCPLDLSPAAFPIDMCARTVLAKAEIVLWRTGESAFHLEVWRSFLDYTGALLAEIARDYL